MGGDREPTLKVAQLEDIDPIPNTTSGPPVPTEIPPPLISSVSRPMTRQTTATFEAAVADQAPARASTDELIDSLLDTPEDAQPTPSSSRSKGKGKEAVPKTLSPTKKPTKEDNTSAIKRLDAAISAIAARVEGNLHETKEEFATIRANLVGLAADISATHATDPRIVEVINSNNKLVAAFTSLRTQTSDTNNAILQSRNQSDNIERALSLLTSQVRALTDTAPTTSISLIPPTSSITAPTPNTSLATPQPFPFTFTQPNAPTYPASRTAPAALALPAVPQSFHMPSVPKAPAPMKRQRINGPTNEIRVMVGPLLWSQDITGQFLSLLRQTANTRDIPDTGIRAYRTTSLYHVSVHFPNHMDAITFVNNWSAATPAGFDMVTATFEQGNF